MRAAARFHADDALRRQRIVAHQELRVLLGVDVVRHHRDLVAFAQPPTQRERQGGLARAHRPADADAQGHDLKSLEYCFSCRDESIASPGTKLESSMVTALSAMPSSRSPRECRMRRPAVRPRGTLLFAAMTRYSGQ